jgi:tRNA(fMet)-specific endonuclease VapC
MTVRYLLDTNIVSCFLRRSSASLEVRLAAEMSAYSVAISALTRAELRFGQAAMAAEDRRRGLIDHFLRQLPCLPWTEQAADCYGTVKAEHRRLGTPIGELDTLIAAHALAEGLILVTHNTRHFERVASLVVEDWLAANPTDQG